MTPSVNVHTCIITQIYRFLWRRVNSFEPNITISPKSVVKWQFNRKQQNKENLNKSKQVQRMWMQWSCSLITFVRLYKFVWNAFMIFECLWAPLHLQCTVRGKKLVKCVLCHVICHFISCVLCAVYCVMACCIMLCHAIPCNATSLILYIVFNFIFIRYQT